MNDHDQSQKELITLLLGMQQDIDGIKLRLNQHARFIRFQEQAIAELRSSAGKLTITMDEEASSFRTPVANDQTLSWGTDKSDSGDIVLAQPDTPGPETDLPHSDIAHISTSDADSMIRNVDFLASVNWSACSGIGEAEGPFPQWGMPNAVRWVVDRNALLQFNASRQSKVRIRMRYLCQLIDQVVKISVNELAILVVKMQNINDFQQCELIVDFEKGINILGLHFSDLIADPNRSGRQLAILIDNIDIEEAE